MADPALLPHAQSALAPAGLEAERLALLFWWMAGAGAVIWILVAGLTAYAVIFGAGPRARRAYIVLGGGVFPTVVLGALLAWSLPMLRAEPRVGPPASLRIEVEGAQWWWRVRYQRPNAAAVETANELRLPLGSVAELELRSADVIHSLWVPPLGGKLDMFPGRTTTLRVKPTKTGRFRGVCAEYCGVSHALMAFDVVVVEPAEFARWLAAQAAPSRAGPSRGRTLFAATGCGACHSVRGTEATGTLGPDLTHVGGRLTLAAGTLPSNRASFEAWIERTHRIKPGALMPSFGMLPADERRALAGYLESLR